MWFVTSKAVFSGVGCSNELYCPSERGLSFKQLISEGLRFQVL